MKVLRNLKHHKGSGNGYKLSGQHIEWSGDDNCIVGDDAVVHGNKNKVFGKRAKIYGNDNSGFGEGAEIDGDRNEWKGQRCNVVGGVGNKLNGQEIKRESAADRQEEADLQEFYQEVARAQNVKRVRLEDRERFVEHPNPKTDLAHDKATDKREKACCICLTNKSICVAMPCSHKSYCVHCALTVTFPNEQEMEMGSVTCAVCRNVVTGIKRIF